MPPSPSPPPAARGGAPAKAGGAKGAPRSPVARGGHRYAWNAPKTARGGGVEKDTHGDADARSVNRLWKMQGYAGVATGIAGKFLPGFDGAITVGVAGGPEADMRRIWYLACAAVFGRYRNVPVTQFQQVEFASSWDLSMKTVTVTLSYKSNPMASLIAEVAVPTLIATVAGGGLGSKLMAVAGAAISVELVAKYLAPGSAADGSPAKDAWAYLHRGPEQLTIGDTWPIWASRGGSPNNAAATGVANWTMNSVPPQTVQKFAVLPVQWRNTANVVREFPYMTGDIATGYPYGFCAPAATKPGFSSDGSSGRAGVADMTNGAVPALPDAGRIIMSVDKRDIRVQPPQPPLDGSTRGSIVELVVQALHAPCYLPKAPANQGAVTAGAGLYAYSGFGGATLGTLAAHMASLGGTKTIHVGPPTGPNGTGPRDVGDMGADYYSFEE